MSSASRPYRSFVLLLAGPVAVLANAQQADTAAPVAQVEVKGATAAYDARRDDTAMQIVVGREALDRYGDASVFDVLKRVPGVTVTTTGRGAQVQMRGLGGGYTQVLVNSERMPAGFSLDTLAPELIERIEILRAPAAELSAQGVAGTINIVLRRVVRAAKEGPRRTVKLGYQGASDIQGPSAALDMSGRGDCASYSFAANVNHDALSRPDVASVEQTIAPDGATSLLRTNATPETGGMNRFGLAPKINWTLDDGDTLEWQTLLNGRRFRNHVHTLITTQTGSPPPVPDVLASMDADYTVLRSELGWTHALAGASLVEARLGVEAVQRHNLQVRVGKGVDGLPATDDHVHVDTRDRGVFSTGKLTRKLDNGHALNVGWDGGVNRRQDLRDEVDTVAALPSGITPHENLSARVARLALYAQDEWTIAPSLSAYAGVRWEGVRTQVDGSALVATRIVSSVWSPVAQLLWKIPESRGDQLRLALSRTYKAPDLDSLVPRRQTWQNNSPLDADYQGNPNLKPELAWGLDAAWEHYWSEAAMVSLSGSARRIGNYTSNVLYFDGSRWIMTPVNADRAESHGLDLETRFPLPAILPGALALDVRASVSRNWSRVDAIPGPDNRMEQQVPLSALLALDYKTGAFTAGASFGFKSAVHARIALDRWAYAYARRDLDA